MTSNGWKPDERFARALSMYFLLFVLVLITYLFMKVIWPFFFVILMGAITTGLFYPLYRWFIRITKDRPSLSSLLSCLAILLVIILPLSAALGIVATQALEFYDRIDGYVSTLSIDSDQLNEMFGLGEYLERFDLDRAEIMDRLAEAGKAVSSFLIRSIQKVTQGAFNVIAMLFLMLFTMYYLFKDGPAFLRNIKRMSPLSEEYEDRLIEKFSSITRATVKGNIVIAVIQGGLGGLAFLIFGVPSFLFWALIMTILSLIPLVGAGLVWLPAGIIKIALGHYGQGIGILLFGGVVISTVDNVLRPKLVGQDTQMHPLMIFFGTIGGIAAFGIIGFIMGPIIAALFVTIWEIYASEFRI